MYLGGGITLAFRVFMNLDGTIFRIKEIETVIGHE